ncbi:hypothetical protein ACELLULO517_27325 [Acidisoma cellulosilytica]|uniref:Uncharacterized protein n=1 Tax=Acidisoma cellulosilyticum TaxID=2802395 RepID=A0A964E6V6_9PROT|nr:hypothetical protein [Acidisoma cellulosilyticum]MCB8883981.1 hypothetical protein [Acidisoma cellulosilyticum]
MTDTTSLAPPPPAPILHDQWGRPYVQQHPIPGLSAVPVTVLELVELWRLNSHAAAYCGSQGRPEEWAHYTRRAQHLLDNARGFNPLLVRMFEQPPHYGSEGNV